MRPTTPAFAALLFILFVLACSPAGPRPLEQSELAQVVVEGRVSKWLPSRFSGTVRNGTALHLHSLELEIHGKQIVKDVRVAPGESKRLSLQYLFPEDEGFGTVDPQQVVWRLIGATASAES